MTQTIITPEMIEAAEEAYMPFGDMGLAIQCALAAAPQPPEAAPVQLPCADDFSKQLAELRDLFPIPAYGAEHEARWMASISDPAEVLAYVTEQVRQLLEQHGIQERST